jgi:Transposase IS4
LCSGLTTCSALVWQRINCYQGQADAAFGSVRTAHELHKRGFYSLLVVKGCVNGFPKQYFKEWGGTNPNRGDHKTLTASIDSEYGHCDMIAVGWCSKKDMIKTFIRTCSTTTPRTPLRVPRTERIEEDGVWMKNTYFKETARPKLLEDLYANFSTIDYYDRLRQGYLKMEVQWQTNKWWKRLFTTILGITFTDCFLE